MKEKPPETIDSILESLSSDNHYERSYAITTIRNNKITDERVIEILKNISTNDQNKNVRDHAHNTLIILGVEPTTGFGDSSQTQKGNGCFGIAVLAILITAGILYYQSSFAGDNETIGFLQGYAIPCLTVLALIITALIAIISNQPKRKEESTQANINQSASQAKAKPIKKAGKKKSNKSTSSQNVEKPLTVEQGIEKVTHDESKSSKKLVAKKVSRKPAKKITTAKAATKRSIQKKE